ncbi:MAG: chorismate mutase [Treponema sp.]|nr:chorismate mutase [Treponema sp.]
MKRLFAIRGATTCENNYDSILKAVHEMCDDIFIKNKIKSEDMVSIQFSMTKDLTALNAAAAVRKGGPAIDCSKVALFCTQEAEIEGGMEKVIRVMVTTYLPRKAEIINVYNNGTDALRPDRKKS